MLNRPVPSALVRSVDVVGRAFHAVGAGMIVAVAVGVLDAEQIDQRRVDDLRREVAADADRRHETRARAPSTPRRRRARVVDVGIRFDLALA